MIHSFHLDAGRHPVRMRWFVGAIWGAILIKCALVWWAVVHWHVPFHPGWIVLPTLLFAALATLLWFGADDE
jgi:hypothetical protein